MPAALPPELVSRFAEDLLALGGGRESLAVAVSGGPDSLALLLLANAAFPGGIATATVDHRLRPEAAGEARHVGAICASLGVPHRILTVTVEPRGDGWQAAARAARYAALESWCVDEAIPLLATAHHADDQSETLLMRLRRGAGLAGLAGVRRSRSLGEIRLVRPLLGWRKTELTAIVEGAGISACDDPSNRDDRFDRTAVRRFLAEAGLDPRPLAASARHLAEAEEALDWAARRELAARRSVDGDATLLDPAGLPAEIVRRLLVLLFAEAGASPDGPALDRLAERLAAGQISTLAGLKIMPGAVWRFEPAPPRRASTSGS